MTTPDTPSTPTPSGAPKADQYQGGAVDEAVDQRVGPDVADAPVDLWDMSFAYELSSGAKPSPNPVTLDAETARAVNKQLREIEEARAAANVSGRDYLIK